MGIRDGKSPDFCSACPFLPYIRGVKLWKREKGAGEDFLIGKTVEWYVIIKTKRKEEIGKKEKNMGRLVRLQQEAENLNTRIQQLFDRCNGDGKESLLVFRGFPKNCTREILERPESVIPAQEILDENGCLRAEKTAHGGETLMQALAGKIGPALMLYEQFLTLNLSQTLENRRIFIVDNNLFEGKYPCILPAEQAAAFCLALQNGEADDETSRQLLTFYGDIQETAPECWMVSFRNGHQPAGLPVEPFYDTQAFCPHPGKDCGGEEVTAAGKDFLLHMTDVQEGKIPGGGTYLLDHPDDWKQPHLRAFFSLLEEKGRPYSFGAARREEEYQGERFLPLLRKYWGKDAQFRPLQFYRSPKENRETVERSQGDVIAAIAAQCDLARKGEEFRNLFVTAPTGAGKSILFQLPALYLAEEYQAVTIVVTPLKALMQDQVSHLEKKQGVTCATYLNSDITYEERQERLRQIQQGEKSIIYLSPELLISASLSDFIGDRPLGLFVVDEAHTVTSWGKDFRADYWYLGEYLRRLSREGRRFPVLCLTATAVYGGAEDVVNETIEGLGVQRPLLYLGRVRRDNITFDIRTLEAPAAGVDKFKIQVAAEQTREFVQNHEKTLFYFPYTSQVDETYTRLEGGIRRRVRKFHSRMQALERNLSQLAFQKNDCDVMLSTKAFGMGVDIADIQTVCHFAPTGNLADYVQEIGRAARQPAIQGRAVTAFLPTDIRYMSTLYRLSELRQFQVRELLRKVTEALCREKKHLIFISPDEFSYLFPGDDDTLQNKVKNGILLLGSDLEKTYGFPALRMMPFSSQEGVNYVNVPERAEKKFLSKYGEYVTFQPDETRLVIRSRNRFFASDTVVRNSGNIYRVDMGALWRGYFQELTYVQFRRRFFTGDLFQCGGDEPLVPRSFISVRYYHPFEESVEEMRRIIRGVSAVFRSYKLEKKAFTQAEFCERLCEELKGNFVRREFSDLLLDMFVTDAPQKPGSMSADKTKFISFRKAADGETGSYRVLNTGYITLETHFMHLISQAIPDEQGVYQAYIPAGRNGRQPSIMKLFSLLELLGIASYSITGGRGQMIPLFVPDPGLLQSLLNGEYVNHQVEDIHRRHLLAEKTMSLFLSGKYDSQQRWDMIEEYFLGRSFLPEE